MLTDGELLPRELSVVFIEAPNLSIPIIRLLYAVEQLGPLFRTYDVSITESHQSRKSSVAGTARALAAAFGREANDIRSIRDRGVQKSMFGIPEEHLDRHAIHSIEIKDEGFVVTIETRALGYDSYPAGIIEISRALAGLENGRYLVTDLVARRLLYPARGSSVESAA